MIFASRFEDLNIGKLKNKNIDKKNSLNYNI